MTHHDFAHGDRPDDSGDHDEAVLSANDPLSQLHAAWQSQDIPEATPELGGCDDETQAVVAWVAAAWAAQPIPSGRPQDVARPLRRLTRPRSWSRSELTRRAAAALLLGGLTLALLFGPHRSLAPRAPNDTVATIEPTLADDSPRLVAVTDDHIVFRSGPVRLVLITDQTLGE